MNHVNQNNAVSSQKAAPDQEIDKSPITTEENIAEKPPGQVTADQDALEAAHMGLEDQSEDIGAEVEAHRDHMAAGKPTKAGVPSPVKEQAKVVGDEAVGGTAPTPDQDNVDEIATAAGINTKEEEPVAVSEELHRRDDQRYELDPDSKGPGASA